jgi:hypothetical protein
MTFDTVQKWFFPACHQDRYFENYRQRDFCYTEFLPKNKSTLTHPENSLLEISLSAMTVESVCCMFVPTVELSGARCFSV